jgi:glycosyltransferase involved in cell wall biosynthesis
MGTLHMASKKPINCVVKKKKIMYIGYPIYNSGAPHQGMAALWLARSNFYIDYFAWGNELPPIWLKDYPTINYQLFNKHGVLSACLFLIKLLRYILNTKPDYIYVQGAQQTPFLLWLSFVKIKSKLIYHTQDYLGPGQHFFYEACERFFARRSDWVISNEVNRARFMASSYRLSRMPDTIRTALPSWWFIPIRDENYRRELLSMAGIREAQQPRLIVAGGGYAVDRMSPEVLIALSQLPRNYALIFTGMEPKSPRYRACKDQIANLDLRERVIILGHLNYAELLRLYAASDLGILLYPNSCVGHFYQAPGRLTEYLRCGLPIVTSNFPGLELLTMKYGLGAVADPYQPDKIAEAINQTINVSDNVLEATRHRLIAIAESDLAYERQANHILGKIFNYES